MESLVIISGAAGSGKDSVIDGLLPLLPIERIITTTTRSMRPGESEGHPYYFVSKATFAEYIAKKQFIEHSVNENHECYGVTEAELRRVTDAGHIAIWRVDWKGVVNIKKLYPHIPAIYIAAPLAVLEARLRLRDQGQSETYFQERMAYTREWLHHLDIYDYQVENQEGKLAATIQAVKAIIEKHCTTR